MNIKYTYNTIYIYTFTVSVFPFALYFSDRSSSWSHFPLPPPPCSHSCSPLHLGQRAMWLSKQPIKPNFWVNSGLQCLSCRIPFTPFSINTCLLLLHSKMSSKNSEESCNDHPCHLKIHWIALCDREEKYASRHHSSTWFEIYGMLSAAYRLSLLPRPQNARESLNTSVTK